MTVKSSFVRLQPRRFLPDAEISFVSGTTYSTSFMPVKPDQVYQQTSIENRNTLSFTYTNGVLEFDTSNAPDDNIFCIYSIYATDTSTKYEKQNPVADTGDVVEWLPRLAAHPSLTQSVKDQLAGIIVSSSSTIALVNSDYYFNDFISKYDNYQNADVTVFVKIGDDFKTLGSGIIKTIKAGKRITFSVKAINKLFEQTATFGNSRKFYKATRDDYPTLQAGDANRPIPYSPGFNSHVPVIPVYYDTGVGSAPYFYTRLIEMDELWVKPIRYDGQDKHIIGVVDDIWDVGEFFTVTEHSRFTETSALLMWLNIPSQYTKSFFVGEPILYRATTGSHLNSYVIDMDYANNRMLVEYYDLPANTIDRIYPHPLIMASIFKSGSTFGDDRKQVSGFNNTGAKLSSGFHDLLTTTTESGQKLVYLDYNPLFGNVDYPYITWFILKNKAPQTFKQHTDNLISGAGLSIDSTSFDAVQTANDVKMFDLIHSGDKNENIVSVLERAGNSTGSLIYTDEDSTVKARIIDDSITGFDYTITSSDILNPDLTPSIEYSDIRSEVSFTNDRVKPEIYYDEINDSATSKFSVGFNDITKIKSYKGYVDDVTTTVQIKKYNDQGPKIFYDFKLSSDLFFDIQVGNVIKIDNVDGRLINLDTEVDVVVLSLTKSATELRVTGYDFQKIP